MIYEIYRIEPAQSEKLMQMVSRFNAEKPIVGPIPGVANKKGVLCQPTCCWADIGFFQGKATLPRTEQIKISGNEKESFCEGFLTCRNFQRTGRGT
jgi:hypothetical protein